MIDKETLALLQLLHLPYIGPIKGRFLIERYGSALAAIEISAEEIAALPGFGTRCASGWKDGKQAKDWQRDLDCVEKKQARLLPYFHPSYPQRLLQIPDFPLLLYVQGSLLPEDDCSLAIIGTRASSAYGNRMAQFFSQDLAGRGLTIVSGLARGIDTIAHQSALPSGRTLAVIGSGLGHLYPKENQELAQAITHKGALISEFPMMTPPNKQNFPRRNRIVAGMTRGTLLIEAPRKSGAMITMEQAFTYRRKLYALPGRADTEDFRGNHHLIRQGQAALVEKPDDIALDFGLQTSEASTSQNIPLLSPDEYAVYKTLSFEEISYDELLHKTQFTPSKLSTTIIGLQLKKLIKEIPGKRFLLNHFIT